MTLANFPIDEQEVRIRRVELGVNKLKEWRYSGNSCPDYRKLNYNDEAMKTNKALLDRVLEVMLEPEHGMNDWTPPMGLVMLGAPGIGKTHLMKAFYRELLRERKTAKWWRAHELVRTIQSSYGVPGKQDERERVIGNTARHDVVFLDDLGKERGSEDVETIMWELFDELYEQRCVLVLSSNFTESSFEKAYDDAVKDRIRGMAHVVSMAGESKRRESGRYKV